MSNGSKPLTRGDIPALIQEIVKTLVTDGGSSTQQGKHKEGQYNNNITNTSSSPPQQGEQQGQLSNSNITNMSSSQPHQGVPPGKLSTVKCMYVHSYVAAVL